jgi:multidrug efflux system membrane fusion protein
VSKNPNALRLHIGFCLLACALAGCQKSAAPNPAAGRGSMPGVPVTVAKAVETSVPVEVHAIGNVEAWSSVQIKSQVAGILTHVDFTEGQEVHKGQLLFQIDPRPYQDTYNQAAAAVARDQAQLQQAQANQARDEAQSQNAEVLANRYAELLKDGVVSKEQHESYATTANMQREALRSDQAAIAQARAAIQADTASLNAAELNLEFCKITAPIDGRTGNLAVKEGNLVKAQADNALVTINQIEPVYVTFSVPETYLSDIRRFSAQGKLQVEAYVGATAPIMGELSFIDNSVNAATGTIQIKGTFRNTDRKLWPGQFINVVLRLATAHNVIVVPSEAIQTGQQGQFAFVVSDKGTVQIRPIKVGQAAGHNTVIESGLAAGDTVVTVGQMLLAPGAPVRIVKMAAASL